ncbi:Type III secretion outermembrane contact sensing protein (YopN,Yop4b,LcrE) [Pectobacterium sp. F1-1]|nr:Type III secretion outermembrane contact sensing protein (YopN,Yop4b,LcrE) [Pectobacterium sp. F1-1]
MAKTEEQALCQPGIVFITLIFNQLFFNLSFIVPFFANANSTKLQVIAISKTAFNSIRHQILSAITFSVLR